MSTTQTSIDISPESPRARLVENKDYFRRIIGAVGLVAIVISEQLRSGPIQYALSDLGFFALLVSAVLLVARRTNLDKVPTSEISLPQSQARALPWRWTFVGLAGFGLIISQAWFRAGTVIAGGDISPPIGTAWIGRIFDTYGWSGSNLGGPVSNQNQLPYAALFKIVHLAGGSGALAQRIGLSLLVAGIMVAASGLARSLGMSPLAGVVVAIFYFFNPLTLTLVGINVVFLVAMVLTAGLPAIVIAYGRGSFRRWQLILAFLIASPLIGFTYANPPLVGMLGLTLMATPLLVWVRFGRSAAAKALFGLLVAGFFAGAASSYWLIPALLSTSSINVGGLSGLSAWAFTESRSTLANAFWLNTSWAWSYSAYFPYSHLFRNVPLSLLRSLIPCLAFLQLALRRKVGDRLGVLQLTRLGGLLAISVLGLIFLSNGTRPPGSILFDPLYHLPYGWLLREPGRFLLVAALGYALLIGILIDRTYAPVRALPVHWSTVGRRYFQVSVVPWFAIGAVIVALLSAFPLWTGSVVPGPRQGFPSTHVAVPKYWETAASYLNSKAAPRGSLLVLPPDDFYQMPYTWYYGNDGFIVNLLDRHVIVPSGQGYFSVSNELLSAVKVENSALLAHNWSEAARILLAVGTPNVLVRGDIESHFSGRNISSPGALNSALANDPAMHLIRRFGQLSIYGLSNSFDQPATGFATISSASPDLALLALLPRHIALVNSSPLVGHDVIVKFPPLSSDVVTSSDLVGRIVLPSPTEWTFKPLLVGTLPRAASPNVNISALNHGQRTATVSYPLGESLISNGDFRSGEWGKVGNCDNFLPVRSAQQLGAHVVRNQTPNGLPALTLYASIDAACESTLLNWHGGNIFLRYTARSLSGSLPRICLWEEPIGRCASVQAISSSVVSPGATWRSNTSIVTPDSGAQSISLFVYADAPTIGTQTVTQYANFIARSVGEVPSVYAIGLPRRPSNSLHLVIGNEGYASSFPSPLGTTHVIVDGLRNGWLTTDNVRVIASIVSRIPARAELKDSILLTVVMLFPAAALLWGERRRKIRNGVPPGA
ncbi:alpha-(1-_3)-arabinofuranosyltransferase family protein [Acidithrix sp. C25]|uniref:alpha-(1->3)-arabinofuranosyltransferase domain-containing protein n=1 Tax=Acidithrix sp. C25 TaxID=1671482 RepID=UPI00191BC35F|nr:alpha-(1->3)-arabinofuranosyltransferase family protein [Acidithrix sp. C25]CAG4910041.1 unnamed protein product [Acidithrix sp. C25]